MWLAYLLAGIGSYTRALYINNEEAFCPFTCQEKVCMMGKTGEREGGGGWGVGDKVISSYA